MILELLLILECLWTYWTFVGLLRGMNLHVSILET